MPEKMTTTPNAKAFIEKLQNALFIKTLVPTLDVIDDARKSENERTIEYINQHRSEWE